VEHETVGADSCAELFEQASLADSRLADDRDDAARDDLRAARQDDDLRSGELFLLVRRHQPHGLQQDRQAEPASVVRDSPGGPQGPVADAGQKTL